jgi:hypothetical protein
MENSNSYQPVGTIGKWDYLRAPNGDLYRARHRIPSENRIPEFYAPRIGTEFALRIVRMAAGLPEHGG